MPLPTSTDILIVGGGPVGLASALALEKEGLKDNIMIVDGTDHLDISSRALVIHSATLEALDTIGCAEPIISRGRKTELTQIWDGSRYMKLSDASLLKGLTKFPFSVFICQYMTEGILEDKVKEKGIRLFRPYKVSGLTPNAKDLNITDVTFESGEVVQARYVIGADGKQSVVRRSTGITYANPFSGARDYDPKETFSQMVLADVIFVEKPPPKLDAMYLFLPGNNGCLWIPLPARSYDSGEQIYRFGVGIPESMGTPPHAPSKEYLQGLVDAFGPGTVKGLHESQFQIREVKWSTRFRQNACIVDTFFTRLGQNTSGGPIAFVGDAAHSHSPFGGQGMNLGLRDAISLGSVIANHLRDSSQPSTDAQTKAKDKGLRAWADNRRLQGLTVINLTRNLLGMANAKNKITWSYGFIPFNKFTFRNMLLRVITQFSFVRKQIAFKISGLGNR